MTTIVLLGACESAPGVGSATLDTDDQKASYGIGRNMGQQLSQQLQGSGDRIDVPALSQGIRDALAERDPAVPEEELAEVLQGFSQSIQEEQQQAREVAGEENQQEGEAFLEENADRDEIVTTESGLQYEVVEEGDGPSPGPDDQVTVHYRGTLVDGTEFDSSYERGEPATFGVTQVIPGFSEGLQLMSVGSTYKFYIPSELGYGPQGSGQVIGPNATLIFEVELLGIE